MAAWGPACSVCHSNDCPGCEVETEGDPELESLEQSPEGQGFEYTEDAVQSFIADCVSTLKDPLCPVVFRKVQAELEAWCGLLDGIRGIGPAFGGIRRENANA